MNVWYQQIISKLFDPNETVCFALIEEKGIVEHGFTSAQKATENGVYEYLHGRNGVASVYIAMNPFKDELRGAKKGRTEENVAKIKRLYADADENGPAVFEKLKKSTTIPQPHIVMETSPGKFQFIWNVDGLTQDSAKKMLKALAQELGTDPAVCETSRVFRLPSFVNRKAKYTGEPIVKLVGDILNRGPYRPGDFQFSNATAVKTESKPEDYLDAPFVHGQLDNQIVQLIGHYMASKNISDPDEMYALVIAKMTDNTFERDGRPFQWNDERVRELCRLKTQTWKTGEEQMREATNDALAESAEIANKALTVATQPRDLALNQKPTTTATAAVTLQPPPEIDTSEGYTRPEFPYWAIMGTSIWNGLVAPALASSSKHAEFIAMPAIQIMLNQLSGRVRVGLSGTNFNTYVGLVSPYGKFFKSSSCDLAMDYFRTMGLLFKKSVGKKEEFAGERTAVIQAGSPEGFGLKARDINAYRALLFNDELGKFVSKAGIEGSAFSSDLLTWYGAGEFGNNTTQPRNRVHFEAGTYTFGWLWATTDRGFNRHWPKLAGISSGLEDRMFFVVSPKEPKPTAPFSDPILVEGAARTRQLIDKAVQQEKFDFESPEWFAKKVSGMDPRSMDLIQKFSLYFCVDMGDSVIGDEHVDRALALVEYRNRAALFLAPIEAENDGARTQKEIIRELRQNRGKMRYRDLCNKLDYTSLEVWKWNRIYQGLVGENLIINLYEQTTPGRRATRMVGLAKQEED